MEASDTTPREPADVPAAPQTADAAPEIAGGASLGAKVGGPEVAAAAERADEANDSGGPYLRTVFPVDRFDSGIKGVPVIESSPTSVKKSDVSKVKEAAAHAGVELIEED